MTTERRGERRINKCELRSIAAREGVSSAGGIGGYAATFNQLSHPLGDEKRKFREIILPGAFNLAESIDVICTFCHNEQTLLGRNTSGTLRLNVDDVGLAFECDVPQSKAFVLEYIDRRDIQGCSFGFDVLPGGETWIDGDDMPIRQLTNIAIVDVGPVIDPAYPGTEIALRSLSAHLQSRHLGRRKSNRNLIEVLSRMCLGDQA